MALAAVEVAGPWRGGVAWPKEGRCGRSLLSPEGGGEEGEHHGAPANSHPRRGGRGDEDDKEGRDEDDGEGGGSGGWVRGGIKGRGSRVRGR